MDLNPYAKYLGRADPVSVLATTSGALQDAIEGLNAEGTNRSPAPGKWSIREIVAHLADCEIVFGFRLRQVLSQEHAQLQPFDQEAWAKRYAAYDLPGAIDLFRTARAWNLRLITSVSEPDRSRPTTHPERGMMTLWTIVETMAGHDINHLQQIKSLATWSAVAEAHRVRPREETVSSRRAPR